MRSALGPDPAPSSASSRFGRIDLTLLLLVIVLVPAAFGQTIREWLLVKLHPNTSAPLAFPWAPASASVPSQTQPLGR